MPHFLNMVRWGRGSFPFALASHGGSKGPWRWMRSDAARRSPKCVAARTRGELPFRALSVRVHARRDLQAALAAAQALHLKILQRFYASGRKRHDAKKPEG